jgi:hypothetical protein
MEDTIQDIQAGIQAAVDAMTGDPRVTCADTAEQMEFRIDQFTRNADGTWSATALVRRDDGWVRLVAKNGVEIGVLSPTSTTNSGLAAKVDAIAIDKGGGAIGIANP